VHSVRILWNSDGIFPKVTVGKNVKVRSTGMHYNTILVIPVHSGWYLSMRFLHVEMARTYSK
jgi:hypothetical protein